MAGLAFRPPCFRRGLGLGLGLASPASLSPASVSPISRIHSTRRVGTCAPSVPSVYSAPAPYSARSGLSFACSWLVPLTRAFSTVSRASKPQPSSAISTASSSSNINTKTNTHANTPTSASSSSPAPASVVRPSSSPARRPPPPAARSSSPALPPRTSSRTARTPAHNPSPDVASSAAQPVSRASPPRSSPGSSGPAPRPESATELGPTDDPVVIYRGGPAFNPTFCDFLAAALFFGGIGLGFLIYGKLPGKLPFFSSLTDSEENNERAYQTLRTVLSSVCAILGVVAASYFVGMQMRTITRMTLHLKSGLVAIRTVKPSLFWFLPRRFLNPQFSGLDHPWATVDGRPGSKLDKRTRVFALENVYMQMQRSTMQYYVRNELMPVETLVLRNVLPKRQTREVSPGVKGTKFTTKESADTEDITFLVVKPYVMLWSIRASAGREEANEGPAWKQKWRRFSLPPIDCDDLSPAQAKALRDGGDAYLSRLVDLSAKQNKVPTDLVRASVMPNGLSERQVWFQDRQTFDDLFPVI